MPLAELINETTKKLLYVCGLIIDNTIIAGQVSLAEIEFPANSVFIFQGKRYILEVPLEQGLNLSAITSLKEVN